MLWGCFCFAQETKKQKPYTIDASPFYGAVLLHNPNISHLITTNPSGFMLGFNRKTYGEKTWESLYNYPDYGASFVYQNMHSETLGEHYAFYAHYNFYFFKRTLQLRAAQGLAYATKPYDKNSNFRNNAYGSRILSATYLTLNYQREHVYKQLGVKVGFSIIHFSNGNFKAPNTSTNTLAFNVGLVYSFSDEMEIPYKKAENSIEKLDVLRYNVVLRGGVNESDVIGSGQYGFVVVTTFVEKQINRKGKIQFGVDFFFSNFLKELIRYQSIAFPELDVTADSDYKRIGLFVGHELALGKNSITTQLGYYAYYPFDFEGRLYNRIGIKRYLSDIVFCAVTLKSHAAAAEAVEFGVGFKF